MKYARAVGACKAPSCFLALCLIFGGAAAKAATISYGNFGPVPPGIVFLNVEESSGTDNVPLYGPPDPFVTGLDFDPTNFVATAVNGGADITDGQLNFTVMGMANPRGTVGVGINAIGLNEAGDYTLAGAGGPGTQVLAGAIIRATITQVDGAPITPLPLFPSNASFSDSLPGVVVAAPWSLSTAIAVLPQLQASGIPFKIGATKVEVVINNQLLALADPNSIAFIAKKDFVITIIPGPHGDIPEPTTALLSVLAVGFVGLFSKRRRSS